MLPIMDECVKMEVTIPTMSMRKHEYLAILPAMLQPHGNISQLHRPPIRSF